MTILEAIETETGHLSRATRFEYEGNLEMANATIFDKIQDGEFPVCLALAFDIVDDRGHGIIKSSAEINMLMLDRLTSEGTVDYPAAKIETEIISPLRALMRELINRLDVLDMVEEEGISAVTNRNVWQAIGDAHLYGTWAVFTIKFTENISTCVDD